MTEPQPTRVILVGAGIFAVDGHGSAWKAEVAAGRVKIVAVWSRTEASARKVAEFYSGNVEVFHGGKFQSDGTSHTVLTPILARKDIDAAIVTTPISLLVPFSLLALRSGKHVLSEKPVASSVDQATAALKSYRDLMSQTKTKLTYAVAENYRFERVFREAQALLGDDKKLGHPILVELTAHMPFPEGNKYEKTDWRKASQHLGGIVMDSGVHFMAALRILAGAEVRGIAAFSDRKTSYLPQVDTVAATMSFGNGVLGALTICFASTTRLFEFRVRAENGLVVISRSASAEGAPGYSLRSGTTDEPDEVHFYPFSGIDEEIKAFVRICQGHGSTQDEERLCVEEALRDLALVEAMLRSSQLGNEGGNAGNCVAPWSQP